MGSLKISDWNLTEEEEENAVLLHVKLSNLRGVKKIVPAFNAVAKSIKAKEGFNALSLMSLTAEVFAALYAIIKENK